MIIYSFFRYIYFKIPERTSLFTYWNLHYNRKYSFTMASYRSSRGGPSSSTAAHSNGGLLLEQQNDEMVDELSNKVSQLKRVTIAIGDDVREQNRLLNEMETKFETTRGILGATMKKLGIVSKAGGRNVLCYLVLFCFFVFLIIYFLMR